MISEAIWHQNPQCQKYLAAWHEEWNHWQMGTGLRELEREAAAMRGRADAKAASRNAISSSLMISTWILFSWRIPCGCGIWSFLLSLPLIDGLSEFGRRIEDRRFNFFFIRFGSFSLVDVVVSFPSILCLRLKIRGRDAFRSEEVWA
jgi:hypothetical protein